MSKSSDFKIIGGQKTVAAAGTREPLATGQSMRVLSVTIKALRGNGGKVYVGDSTVSSTVGFELDAADSVTLETRDPKNLVNLSQIYLDVSVNGEGVSYIYLRE